MLAVVTGLTAAVIVGTFALLCLLAIWDYRRICKRSDQARRTKSHLGKTRVGRRVA